MKGKKILLIENNSKIQRQIIDTLTPKFQITTVTTSEQSLEPLQNGGYEAVIFQYQERPPKGCPLPHTAFVMYSTQEPLMFREYDDEHCATMSFGLDRLFEEVDYLVRVRSTPESR